MDIKATLKGAAQARSAIASKARLAQLGALQGTYLAGQKVMRDSKRVCPVSTGLLRSTGFVNPPVVTGAARVSCVLGYGTWYALPVHERTWVHHAMGTQAKFLEQPLLQNVQYVRSKVGSEVARALA